MEDFRVELIDKVYEVFQAKLVEDFTKKVDKLSEDVDNNDIDGIYIFIDKVFDLIDETMSINDKFLDEILRRTDPDLYDILEVDSDEDEDITKEEE